MTNTLAYYDTLITDIKGCQKVGDRLKQKKKERETGIHRNIQTEKERDRQEEKKREDRKKKQRDRKKKIVISQ